MTTFQIIVDNLLRHTSTPQDRYTRQVARALTRTAPDQVDVVAVVGLHTDAELAELTDDIPGIASVQSLAIKSDQMDIGWRFGIPPKLIADGITHSPTLLAPRFSHDRTVDPGTQTVATVHDVTLWEAPDTLSFAARSLARIAWRRAESTIDAFVATNNHVAEVLAAETRVADRVRVVPAAPTRFSSATLPSDDLRSRLQLPTRYLAVPAQIDEATLLLLLAAVKNTTKQISLVIFGEPIAYSKPLAQLTAEMGISPDALIDVGVVTEAEELALLTNARALLALSARDTLGLSVLDAMGLGVPIIHTDNPVYIELTGGAALVLDAAAPDFVDQLVNALETFATARKLPAQLALEAQDRSENFSWDESARKIWQLHADL